MTRRVGRLNAIATAQTAPFTRGMDRMNRSMGLSRRSARLTQRVFARLTATLLPLVAGTLSARAAWRALSNEFSNIDDLAKSARAISVAVEELRGLRFAAGEAGIEGSRLDNALDALNRRMGRLAQGSATVAEALQAIGLDPDQILGMDTEQRFIAIAGAIEQVGVNSDRATFALEQLFGRSGTALRPLFAQGTAEIERAIQAARELGGVITDDMTARVEQANDSLGRAKMRIGAAATEMAVGLAPVVEDVAEAFIEWLGPLEESGERIEKIERIARGIFELSKSTARNWQVIRSALSGDASDVFADAIIAKARDVVGAEPVDTLTIDVVIQKQKELREEIERTEQAQKDALSDLTNEFSSLQRELDPTIDKSEEYRRQLELIEEAERAGVASAREAARARELLQQEIDAPMLRSAEQLEDSLRTPTEQIKQELEEARKLFDEGFIDEEVMQRAADRAASKMKELREEAERARRAMFDEMFGPHIQQAEALEQSLLTPLEKIKQEFQEAQNLFDMGFIDEEVMTRAMERAAAQVRDLQEDMVEHNPFEEMNDGAQEFERRMQRIFSLLRGEAITGSAGSVRIGPTATAQGFPQIGGMQDFQTPNIMQREREQTGDPEMQRLMLDFLSEIARNTRDRKAVL